MDRALPKSLRRSGKRCTAASQRFGAWVYIWIKLTSQTQSAWYQGYTFSSDYSGVLKPKASIQVLCLIKMTWLNQHLYDYIPKRLSKVAASRYTNSFLPAITATSPVYRTITLKTKTNLFLPDLMSLDTYFRVAEILNASGMGKL